MSTPSLRKNYLYNLSAQILTLITPFITTPYVSRVLEADGIGIYSFTSAVMTYFTMFAALGTVNYGQREVARLRENKYEVSKKFWEIETTTLLTTAICSVTWLMVILESHEYKYYYLALFPTLLAVPADITWFYIGIEKVSYTVIRNMLCKVVGIVLLFVIVRHKDDLIWYMLLNSSITLVGNLSMWPAVRKFIQRVRFSELSVLSSIKASLTYFVLAISISLYTVLDKLLIGFITHSEYQNGYYEQATKIINIAKTISFVAVNGIMTARMSYLFEKNLIEEIHQRIQRSMNFILMISWGSVFGIISIAPVFVPVFFGPGYEEVIPLLYLMAPLIFIISLSTCSGSHYYLPKGKISKSTKYTIIGSIVNLLVNILLIPYLGAEGAAIGTVIGESLISILYISHCEGLLTFRHIFQYSWKRILAGVLMFVCCFALRRYMITSAVIILISMIIFGGLIYIFSLYVLKDQFTISLIKEQVTNRICKRTR